jgi:hypothetical protein
MDMSTISIPVNAEIAELYENASPEDRRKVEVLFNFLMGSVAKYDTRSLETVMKEMREQAKARGLTPEILESILNDDSDVADHSL